MLRSLVGSEMCIRDSIKAQAGGRHDNDHADFRRIQVMPTIEELMSDEPPYLPDFSPNEGAVLDRQFRLLREDFIGPARAELKLLKENKVSRRTLFEDVEVTGIECEEATNKPSVIVRLSLPQGHRTHKMKTRKERKQYWETQGKNMLPHQALVCLVKDGSAMHFALVAKRDPDGLAGLSNDDRDPQIGLVIQGDSFTVLDMLFQIGRGAVWKILQLSTNYFSYEPVLKVLQGKDCLALAQEMLDADAPLVTPAYLLDVQVASSFPDNVNPSQRRALEQALSSRVALLQGPPGTGKTFIASTICEIIHSKSTETILVVAYTNHALDQLLENLLAKGITSMVRLGGRSKSKILEPVSYTHLRAHETPEHLVCRLLLEKKKKPKT
eukprot:TRINITY_DN32025_c0_g2_i1.p1 TRINITY_DN32025_c0_g2~~TRINITY_DN32025_c0_g2_i1.p1  ORF type:complete len:383 (+),score=75.17 TRINITY_DN32025_c0_g2_i1:113-1261(+)